MLLPINEYEFFYVAEKNKTSVLAVITEFLNFKKNWAFLYVPSIGSAP